MRDLNVSRLEFDEIGSLLARTESRSRWRSCTVGDQYTFVALGGSSKAIISYYTGSAP